MPQLTVTVREGTTPALTRALRAGTLDLADHRPHAAAGLAITTLTPITLDVLPNGVKAVAVRGEPREIRRIVLARRPGPLDGRTARLADALIAAAAA